MNFARLRIGHWVGSWFFFLSIILLIGTVGGALVHYVIGTIFFDYPADYLLARGATNGFFYSGVWSGGLSIVLCFIRGHRENERKRQALEQAEGGQYGQSTS